VTTFGVTPVFTDSLQAPVAVAEARWGTAVAARTAAPEAARTVANIA
jgi:hypothetical protein